MRSSWKILLAVGAVLLVTPAATLASSGSGGGGGGTTTSATVVAGVSVAPTKVAFLSVATGTVRLNKVAASPVTVVVSNDVFNSPNLVDDAGAGDGAGRELEHELPRAGGRGCTG